MYLLFKNLYVYWLHTSVFLCLYLMGIWLNCIVVEWKLISTGYWKIFANILSATFILCQHFTVVVHTRVKFVLKIISVLRVVLDYHTLYTLNFLTKRHAPGDVTVSL